MEYSSGKIDSRKTAILVGDGNVKNSEDWTGYVLSSGVFCAAFVRFFSFLFQHLGGYLSVNV